MPALHLVENLQNLWRVPEISDEWESGYWDVKETAAHKLIGGMLYLHQGQLKPAHFGGILLGFRIVQEGQYQGRIIFRFRFLPACRGVKTSRQGWGNEKKFVW